MYGAAPSEDKSGGGGGVEGGRGPSVYQRNEAAHVHDESSKRLTLALQSISVMQLLVTIVMFGSDVWFANFTGLVMAGMGVLGTRQMKADYLFTYMVLSVLEFAKNVGMVIFFFGIAHTLRSKYENAIIALAIVENVLLQPSGVFAAFKLTKLIRG